MFKWKKNVETKDRQKRKGKEGGRACARPQRHLPHPQRESAPDCRLQSKSLRGEGGVSAQGSLVHPTHALWEEGWEGSSSGEFDLTPLTHSRPQGEFGLIWEDGSLGFYGIQMNVQEAISLNRKEHHPSYNRGQQMQNKCSLSWQ